MHIYEINLNAKVFADQIYHLFFSAPVHSVTFEIGAAFINNCWPSPCLLCNLVQLLYSQPVGQDQLPHNLVVLYMVRISLSFFFKRLFLLCISLTNVFCHYRFRHGLIMSLWMQWHKMLFETKNVCMYHAVFILQYVWMCNGRYSWFCCFFINSLTMTKNKEFLVFVMTFCDLFWKLVLEIVLWIRCEL